MVNPRKPVRSSFLGMGVALSFCLAFATGCPTSPGTDGGTTPPGTDAGKPDSGVVDSGVPDSGVTDSGTPTCPAACTNGLCLPDGTCVDCLHDDNCGGATARCEPVSHTCVACLPPAGGFGTSDCAAGTYCGGDFTCHRGCQSDAACSSGTCLATHDCGDCADDTECTLANHCGTGVCSAPCGTGLPACGTGLTCCSGACVDVSRDVGNCNGCGLACDADEFCGGSGIGCEPLGFSNICLSNNAVILADGNISDGDAGTAILQTLQTTCNDTGMVFSGAFQQDGGIVDYPSGRPLTRGGTLIVAPGGSFSDTGQKLASYLEDHGITNPYDDSSLFAEVLKTRDAGTPVDAGVGALPTQINDSHDFFIVELVHDPLRGSTSLLVYGYYGTGTLAGTAYLNTFVLPHPENFTDNWYIVEWNGPGFDAGNYTVVTSGN